MLRGEKRHDRDVTGFRPELFYNLLRFCEGRFTRLSGEIERERSIGEGSCRPDLEISVACGQISVACRG